MNKIDKSAKAANKTERKDSVTGNDVAPVESIQDNKHLTSEQTTLFAKHEATIREKLQSHLEVGEAFCGISEQRLYRGEFGTFAEYCEQKWNITARHANRLMRAFEVDRNLKSDPGVSSAAIPTSEKSSRPLQSLTPEQQRVAAKLVDQQPGKHTTAHYQAAADKVAGKSKKEQASEKPDEQDDDKPRVTSYTPDKPVEPQVKTTNQPKDNDGLEKLMELLDEAETQARKIGGCDEVVKTLHELSKVITKKLNGGAK